MKEESWEATLGYTYAVARAFGRIEFDSLARRVIHRLQRITASGIFGDNCTHKALWDEYCHEVQHGSHDMLADAWGLTLRPFVDDIIGRTPTHVAAQLSIFAIWDSEGEFIGADSASIYPDATRTAVLQRLSSMARSRSIRKFDKTCLG